MSNRTLNLTDDLVDYVRRYGVREHPALARLRDDTSSMPMAQMQIASEQGAFMALLVRLIGARRILEIGTFTGYSSTAMALALPPDGRIVCLDVSEEWTSRAQEAWADAGVADRAELRIGPAAESLETLDDDSFDLAFIDADKTGYDTYYEGCLRVVRPGGLILIDNVLQGGRVVDPSADDENVQAIRALNEKIASDERVDMTLLPVADGSDDGAHPLVPDVARIATGRGSPRLPSSHPALPADPPSGVTAISRSCGRPRRSASSATRSRSWPCPWSRSSPSARRRSRSASWARSSSCRSSCSPSRPASGWIGCGAGRSSSAPTSDAPSC